MSHIVTIETRVRDAEAVRAACQRLGLDAPVEGKAELYSGTVEGLLVRLPAWRYPVCCDLSSGRLLYDNHGGRWGEDTHLHRFVQAYAVEKTRLAARRQGHTVTEQALPDGSIRLTVRLAT